MTIEQREFVRHFSKYLKQPNKYCVHGRDNDYIVTITIVSKETKDFNSYGCGCEKIPCDDLCRTHGRT